MFRNYLKTALRFLKQNKLFAGINTIGLSVALTASFIILLYVINELSYDHCHKNRDKIFRVLNYYVDQKYTQPGTPFVLQTDLKEEFPQIKKTVCTRNVKQFKLKIKDEFINVQDAIATDSDIFEIFTIRLIRGTSLKDILSDKNSIILSRELATKLFQKKDPTGEEVIGLVNNEEHLLTVKGVFEDIPINSTLRASCFINSKWTIDDINKTFEITNAEENWNQNFWTTWVMLSTNSEAANIEKQFHAFEVKHLGEKPNNNYSLQNLSDVYLASANISDNGITGNLKNIRLFSAIAFLILLVATINYIILSTAVSAGRTMEIGIRKTNGASSSTIKKQLLSESVLVTLFALPISLLLTWFALPYAGQLFQTKLQIINSNIIIYISVYILLAVLIGIISGIYTSIYLSRLKVVEVLKNVSSSGKRKVGIRSALIGIQLVIFCSFFAGTLIIRSQYQYAISKDLGYHSSNILLIDIGSNFKGYTSYVNKINQNPNVLMAAGTMAGLPMDNSMSFMIPNYQDKSQQIQVEGMAVDYKFLKTIGIRIIEGRDFSEEFGSDLSQAEILNETAVKRLGIPDPVGKTIFGKTIIGVAKDFNLHSIRTDIPPSVIFLTDLFISQVAVRYKEGTLIRVLPILKKEWEEIAPDKPFRYTTIEDVIKNLYSSEKNLSTIVSIFAFFTLLISSFGLFGLTLFTARSRTKEIGIKKVFGCSEKTIVYSFLKGNLVMVLVASIVSVPITIYFLSRWLNTFSYHTTIDWWIFALVFVVAALVVLLTVVIHSLKASRTNPVKTLKYE